MEFPGFFLYSSGFVNFSSDYYEPMKVKNFTITLGKETGRKILLIESDSLILLAHVNESFRRIINVKPEEIELLLESEVLSDPGFSWGFFVIINKRNGDFILFNDHFGIYPLYYYHSGKDLIISNDLAGILNKINKLNINTLGVYDYFLFNYTLRYRTIFRDVNQLEGGSILEYKNKSLLIKRTNFLSGYLFSERRNSSVEEMASALMENIKLNLNPDISNTLPLTGGFDSKIVLSLLLSQNVHFSAFTFGDRASDDLMAALSIADRFDLQHNFLEMDTQFINNLDIQINDFLRFHPNAPMLDTLIYYQLVKQNIDVSNLITGIMGGEMIVGPVLISQLITTRTAAFLTSCRNDNELLEGVGHFILEQGIFNYDLFKSESEIFIGPLLEYLRDRDNNENIIRFLLNETYAKFFGVVFSNLFSKCNFINPLVDIEFLRLLFNSKYSFVNKPAFSKAPLSHFNSRRLYPEIIKNIYSPVLNTRMDRGYYLEDFLKWHKFLRPFANYFKRHYVNKGRNMPVNSSGYLAALVSISKDHILESGLLDLEIFNKNSILQLIQNKTLNNNQFQKQKLLQLLTLSFVVKKYGVSL